MTKRVANFLGDKFASRMQAKQVERYYHQRGFTNVRVWVEEVETPSPHYAIRSNIKFAPFKDSK